MKTLLFLADGFEEIEALATVDILRRAGIDVTTVSVTNKKTVVGKMGVPVTADTLFEEMNTSDVEMLILPGGPGVSFLDKHEALKNLVKEFHKDNKWIAAICAAPTVFGKMGLLEGRKAVCYPGLEGDLKGACVQDEAVVVHDGNVITSKGPGTTFEFALKIVEVLKGADKAREVAKNMVYHKNEWN